MVRNAHMSHSRMGTAAAPRQSWRNGSSLTLNSAGVVDPLFLVSQREMEEQG